METRFDPDRDAINRAKHGLSRAFGYEVMRDPLWVDLDSERAEDGEARRKAVGRVGEKLYTAVHVWRDSPLHVGAAQQPAGGKRITQAGVPGMKPDPELDPKRIAIPADPDDPEDFDVTAEALEAGHRRRAIRLTRIRLGLTQEEFAARYRIALGTLRDWEQGRNTPPDHAIAYMRVIAAEPDLIARLVA